jgi:hypothetical protein
MKQKKPGLWGIVCDMEDDVQTVMDYATALALIAETLGDTHGRVVQRLAWGIKQHQEKVEERRGLLFHAMHPNAKAGMHS